MDSVTISYILLCLVLSVSRRKVAPNVKHSGTISSIFRMYRNSVLGYCESRHSTFTDTCLRRNVNQAKEFDTRTTHLSLIKMNIDEWK